MSPRRKVLRSLPVRILRCWKWRSRFFLISRVALKYWLWKSLFHHHIYDGAVNEFHPVWINFFTLKFCAVISRCVVGFINLHSSTVWTPINIFKYWISFSLEPRVEGKDMRHQRLYLSGFRFIGQKHHLGCRMLLGFRFVGQEEIILVVVG